MNGLTADRRAIEAELAARARALAIPAAEIGDVPLTRLVTFRAGGERYAVDVAYVHRLERCTRVTPLPGSAKCFAGITNLHGQLVPLLDLGLLLGAAPAIDAAFVVVLGAERAEIGIVAEELLEMRDVPLATHITADGIAVIDVPAVIATTMHEEKPG